MLIRWLDAQGVVGAAGLVDRYGARVVLDTLNREQMVVQDRIAWTRDRRLKWRISARFHNPGAFLNWALSRGRYRRPARPSK